MNAELKSILHQGFKDFMETKFVGGPDQRPPVESLSEATKFALAVSAGARIETVQDGKHAMKLATEPVSIVRIDGRYRVFLMAPK